MADEEALKRKYKEFLDLMPLTIAIAGLPQSQLGSSFTSDQLEVRATVLGNSFKLARKLARDVIREQ